MQNKGTILIVDDRLEEKIGKFQGFLENDGYSIQIAETLEKAEKYLAELLAKNSLDGIILDFSFPVNGKDPSVQSKGKPNGVALYEKFNFKIRTQGIPIIINTTGDDEYKKKYLGDIDNLGIPVYNVKHESNPLANSTGKQMKEILDLFHYRSETRGIKGENGWGNKLKGKSGAPINGKWVYSRDGD